MSGTLFCNIGVCTVVICAHSRLTRGPNLAKNGQKLAQKAFFGHFGHFWPRDKIKTIFENAYQASLDGSFGFLIGGHFSGPFLPIFGFNHKSVFIRVFYAY